MIEIFIRNLNKVIRIPEEKVRLIEILQKNGIPIQTLCGGFGKCCKCIVKFLKIEGEISKPTKSELEVLKDKINEGYRFACLTYVTSGYYEIEVINLMKGVKYASYGLERITKFKPVVSSSILKISHDMFKSINVRGIDQYLINTTNTSSFRKLNILRKLSNKFFEDIHREFTIYTIKHINEIIDLKFNDKIYGVGIDVGTTKIVINLIDLKSGILIDYCVIENPQIKYGADIISRIEYCMKNPDNLNELRICLLQEINNQLSKLYKIHGIDKDDVYVVVIAGNSVMTHLILGVNPITLGYFPYTPIISKPYVLDNSELQFYINDNGIVYVFPSLGSFIGGDLVANLIAVDIFSKSGNVMFIDIGTNTEIALKTRDGKLYITSTPAGSAIDGVGIKFGVRPIPGAIEHVYIDSELNVKYVTIENEKPIGLTGTGILDSISELLKNNVLLRNGKFNRDIKHPRLRVKNEDIDFVLVWKNESGYNEDIVITQKDVRLIQYAKAAIKAGWKTLLRTANLNENEIDELYIAGSFGSEIRKDTALNLGLIPKISEERIYYVGNTVISGIRAIMRDIDLWYTEVIKIYEIAKVIELPLVKDFSKLFIECTMFM